MVSMKRVTISGSGPTVVVWARRAEADACRAELERLAPEALVLPLAVTAAGAA